MAVATEDFIKQIDEMTVIELNTLVKALEDHYGVSAAAVAVGPALAADAEPDAEVQTEFNVMLNSYGDKKINVIKVVRQVTSLGLKEAKDLVESCPVAVKEAVSKEEAEEIKTKLDDAGAQVELK